METVPINYFAVVVAAAAMMALGFAWYGPLFGKQWAQLSGLTMGPDTKPKPITLVLMIISTLLMSFVLAHALIFASAYTQIFGIGAGLQAGFWNWLGFIAPVTLSAVLWEHKPWKLWAIHSGYYLVGLCIMGIILALWV